MGITILVADDDRLTRRSVKEMLTPGKCKLLEAEDGVEALDLITSEGVDILITDVFMPEMDGIKLCKRAQELNPNLKIIGMSHGGSFGPSRVGELADGYYHAFLEKPFNRQKLLREIKNLEISGDPYVLESFLESFLDSIPNC